MSTTVQTVVKLNGCARGLSSLPTSVFSHITSVSSPSTSQPVDRNNSIKSTQECYFPSRFSKTHLHWLTAEHRLQMSCGENNEDANPALREQLRGCILISGGIQTQCTLPRLAAIPKPFQPLSRFQHIWMTWEFNQIHKFQTSSHWPLSSLEVTAVFIFRHNWMSYIG